MISTWYRIIVLVLGAVLAGCSGKDLAQSPQTSNTTPSFRIVEAVFVPESGVVRVEWSQTAVEAVREYALERQFGDDGYLPVTEISANALGSRTSIQDTAVVSGEQAMYRIAAKTLDGQTHYSSAMKVLVPGAKMEDIRLDRSNMTAQVRWRADSEVALGYEVLRQAGDDAPKIIFQSSDPTVTVLEDGPLPGNMRYAYQVQTILKTRKRIVSRAETSGFYLSHKQVQVTTASNARLRLAVFQDAGDRGVTGPLVYSFNQNRFEIHKLWHLNSPFTTAIDFIRSEIQAMPLDLESVSFIGYEIHININFSENFVVGIHPDTHALTIQMYAFDNNIPYTWTSAPKTWQIGAAYQRTAVTRAPDGKLFVVAGGMLKVFSVIPEIGTNNAALNEKGEVSIPDMSDPGDIVITKDRIVWLSFSSKNKLLKGQVQFSADGVLQKVNWQDVTPPGVYPRALTVNVEGNVLTLDLHNRKVWVLDSSDGHVITYLDLTGTGFENGGLIDGDLVSGARAGFFDATDLLYVSNAVGQVEMFATQ